MVNDLMPDGYSRSNWMNGLGEMSKYNARHILSAFAVFGIPQVYLDVGCGDGTMVRTAQALGIDAFGIDQLVEPNWGEKFINANLVDYIKLPYQAQLVTCFEVAEHIHESAHATLCNTIADNLQGGGHFLLFSAARPGQNGTGHVACRPAEYWHNEFLLRNLSYNNVMTMTLAAIWSRIGTPLNYLYDNLMVFEK